MSELPRRFLTFAAFGLVGTAVHFCVLTACVVAAGWSPVAASSLGALAGAMTNYGLNYRINYRSPAPHPRTLPRFMAVAIMGFVFNGLLMNLLAETLVWHFLLAQALTTALVLAWNFCANHFWTFLPQGEARAR